MDLVSEEAGYHKTCCVNFKTNKKIRVGFSSNVWPNKEKLGRPANLKRKQAFLQVASYLQQNDVEQLTLTDFVTKMGKNFKNSDLEPYSVPHMKSQLEEHFRDQIVVTEINGKHNVVTFFSTVKTIILHKFCTQNRSKDDSESEAIRIIETAAKLIKNDVRSEEATPDYYPS